MRLVSAALAIAVAFTPVASQAQDGIGDPAAEQQLAQWDHWQMLLETSERCPIMAPYLRWGLASQIAYLEDPDSPLGLVLAQEAAEAYGPGEDAAAAFRMEFFNERRETVRQLFAGRSCADPELQSMALEAQPLARFGLYEKLYVFTRVEGGFCAPPEITAAVAPTFKQEMARIEQSVPKVKALKTQVDALSAADVQDHCIGSGARRTATDPMTGNMLYDYLSDLEQRTYGYPYELILPLVPTSIKAPSYMAWRAREGGEKGQVAAGLLATGLCLSPMEKFREDGTARGKTEDIDLYFGVDRDGNLVAQIGADKKLNITEVYLDVAKSGSLPASREEPPLALTAKAIARASEPGRLKRYVFDRALVESAISSAAPVAVRFKNSDGDDEALWTSSGCVFDLKTLYQAYGWATEANGIGKVIE